MKIYDKCCEWLEIVIKSYKKRELYGFKAKFEENKKKIKMHKKYKFCKICIFVFHFLPLCVRHEISINTVFDLNFAMADVFTFL